MFSRVFILLLILLNGVLAAANSSDLVVQRLDLEAHIERRIREIILPVDGAAVVRADIRLKKFDAEIPELGFTAKGVSPLNYNGTLGSLSVESVLVDVQTRLNPFPEWLKTSIQSSVRIDGVTIQMRFRALTDRQKTEIEDLRFKMGSSTVGDIHKTLKTFGLERWGNIFGGVEKHVSELSQSGKWIGLAVGGGLLFLSLLLWLSVSALKNSLIQTIEQKLIPVINQSSRSETSRLPSAEKAKESEGLADQGKAPAHLDADPRIKEISFQVLNQLFWDCYWTEKDGYAHYLWTAVSMSQRDQLIQQSGLPRRYFEHIVRFNAEDLGYIHHVAYTKANGEFNGVDQKDLAGWIRENKSHFKRIPPLRFDYLELPIADKLDLMSIAELTDGVENEVIRLDTKSPPRHLPSPIRLGVISLDDENVLWARRHELSTEIKRAAKTFIWLAEREADYLNKIFADLDARQIASVWSGPEEVLRIFAQAIPEKKMELVQSYSQDGRTSKLDNPVHDYLVEAAWANRPEIILQPVAPESDMTDPDAPSDQEAA